MKYNNNFLIVCESRTGSTMLSTALNQHPQVCMHGEILQPRQFNVKRRDDNLEFQGIDYKSPGAMIHMLRSKLLSDPVEYVKQFGFYVGDYKCAGFKFKYEELSHELFEQATRFVASQPEIKIIHLTRDNLWHRFRSGYIAKHITKKYNSTTEQLDVDTTNKHTIDVDMIKRSFEKSIKWQAQYTELFKQHDVLCITYENMMREPVATFDLVTKHLQVDSYDWKPKTKKIKQVNDHDLIENMSQIIDKFSTWNVSKYLND